MNNPINRAADGKIIVDRAYIENTLRKRVTLTCVIAGIFLLCYVAVISFVVIKYGISNPKAALYFFFLALTFAYIAFPLKTDLAVLSAAKNGAISVTEDTVAGKYVRSGRRNTSYHVKGTAYGDAHLPSVSAKEYRDASVGETFWLVSVQTKTKPVNCAVYLSSSYTLSGELTMLLHSRPGAADAGASGGSPATDAADSPVSVSLYPAENDHNVTSHYGEAHGKVTCASCGKKFDCRKYGDTCPKCGRQEGDVPFERIRRITGYLVGTLDRFNDAKRREVSERTVHGGMQNQEEVQK